MTAINEESQVEKITLYVDGELVGLIPFFIENRRKDIAAVRKALEEKNYDAIRAIAEKMKEGGELYGVEGVFETGKSVEQALNENAVDKIEKLIDQLSHYLEKVEVLDASMVSKCKWCGKTFPIREIAGEKTEYCKECLVVLKDERVAEEKKKSRTRRRALIDRICLIVIGPMIVTVGIVWFTQLPDLFEITKPKKPLRVGWYDTNEIADRCIENLWKISSDFQENKTPDPALVCPATGVPYRMEGMKAFCPNAEKHGLKSLSVSKQNRIPEVIR